MKLTRTISITLTSFGAAMALAACSDAPDPAALEAGDAAFTGIESNGGLAPVAARAVRIGIQGDDKPACAAPVTMAQPVEVRWSNSASGPVKVRQTGDISACDADGDWVGIVFPAAGQDIEDCGISRSVKTPREYQGPCRWGWIEKGSLAQPAG
jgi:hypothetical protein